MEKKVSSYLTYAYIYIIYIYILCLFVFIHYSVGIFCFSQKQFSKEDL